VLLQQRRQVGVGDEVASHGKSARDLTVDTQEAGLLGQEADVGEPRERLSTLPSASEGESGEAKMRGWVAILR
jgi:hypothetical protein